MIVCSECGAGVEVTEVFENGEYNSSIDAYDCEWYFFVPYEDGTYLFETTGNYDPCCDVYVGEYLYPTGNGEYFDDEGTGNNFMFTWDLQAGEVIFLRVKGYDWYSSVDDYTLHVTRVD